MHPRHAALLVVAAPTALGEVHAASSLSRRAVIGALAAASRKEPPPQQQLVLPLLPGRSGALCLPVHVGESRFECAVDTGSPFLLLPSQPSVEAASTEVFPPTTEIYGANKLTLSASPLIDGATDALPLIDPRRYGDGVAHYAVRAERLRLDGATVRTRRPILAVFDSGLTGCVFSQSLMDELPELTDYIRPTPSRARLGRVDLTMRTERGRLCTLRAGRDTSPLFYSQSVELNWFAGGGPSVARARAAGAWLGVPADASAPPTGEGNVAGRTPFNARGARRGSPGRAPHVIALGQAFLGEAVLTVDIDAGRAVLA